MSTVSRSATQHVKMFEEEGAEFSVSPNSTPNCRDCEDYLSLGNEHEFELAMQDAAALRDALNVEAATLAQEEAQWRAFADRSQTNDWNEAW